MAPYLLPFLYPSKAGSFINDCAHDNDVASTCSDNVFL